MSNCVVVHNNIVMSADVIDIQKLFDDMEDHDYVNDEGFDKFFAPEASDKEFMFYWFIGKGNFYTLKNGDLEMCLGSHRSGHTQRDLRHLQKFLSQYLLTDEILKIPVILADEYDGFLEYDDELVFNRRAK